MEARAILKTIENYAFKLRRSLRFEFRHLLGSSSVSSAFRKTVQKFPDYIAVKSYNHQWSYRRLETEAARISIMVSGTLKGKGRTAALLLSHDAPAIAAILGVLQSGNIYIPLDPSYPPNLLRHILSNSGAGMILTDAENAAIADQLSKPGVPVVRITDENLPPVTGFAASPSKIRVSRRDTAYMMYTSGSENTPKGVRHTHQNILRLARVHSAGMRMNPGDRVLLIVSLSFSMSVMDIYAALLSGAGLWMLDIKKHGFAAAADWIDTEQISIYHSAAAHFTQFCAALPPERTFPTIKTVKLGGETITHHHFRLFRRHFAAGCRFFIGYGLSEILAVTQRFIDNGHDVETGVLSIGRPAEGVRVSIIDEHNRPVPSGEAGELAIFSRFLFHGYQTAGDNPAAALPLPGKCFHTGDMAMMNPDGSILHLGRKDSQTKVNGARIRLEEVEDALLQHPLVKEALVIKKSPGDSADYLEAWIVCSDAADNHKNTGQHLRLFLFDKLPGHMIPATVRIVPDLPRTATGKADRRFFDTFHCWRPGFQTVRLPIQAIGSESSASRASLSRRLLFSDGSPLAEDLERRLREGDAGLSVVCFHDTPGETAPGRFGVRRGHEDDFRLLFEWLKNNDMLPDRVIFLWQGETAKEKDRDAHTPDWDGGNPMDEGFWGLILLTRALTAYISAKPMGFALDIISGPVFSVSGVERLQPARAGLIGPCRVIPLEYPFISCRYIDTDPAAPPGDTAAVLLPLLPHAPESAGTSGIMVIRSGALYRETLERWEPSVSRTGDAGGRLKMGGTYVITGGTGGVGLTFAGYLAEEYHAKLALISRTPAEQRPGAPERLREWEARGAEIMTLNADVTDFSELEAAFRQIRERFGAVNGVIHAAGAVAPRSLALKERGSATLVLGAKYFGALHLLRLLSDNPPDFLMLCSSLTVHTGRAGMMDYVAANACLDAFAEALTHRTFLQSPATGLETPVTIPSDNDAAGRSFPVVSINWDSWKETGMMASHIKHGFNDASRRRILEYALSPGEGVAALRAILSDPAFPAGSRLAVSKRLPALWSEKTPAAADEAVFRKIPHLFPAPINTTETALMTLWEKWLHLPSVSPTDNFFQAGGDSLKAAGLCAEIARRFRRPLTIDTLFRYPTIRLLAKALSAEPAPPAESARNLIPLRETGEKAPFFCVHNLIGTVWSIALLRDYLPPDRPFYGLQAQGLDGVAPPVRRIETMAENYLREILDMTPHGPYYLGGRCMGGLIALEMAQRLMEMGHSDVRLALFDSRPPLRLSCNPAPETAGEPFPGDPSQNKLFARIAAAHHEAVNYYSGRPFAGRIDLFSTPYTEELFPVMEHWRKLAKGEFHYYRIPCRHEDLFSVPWVYAVAEHLEQFFHD